MICLGSVTAPQRSQPLCPCLWLWAYILHLWSSCRHGANIMLFESSQHPMQSQCMDRHWGCTIRANHSCCRRMKCQGNFSHTLKEGGSDGPQFRACYHQLWIPYWVTFASPLLLTETVPGNLTDICILSPVGLFQEVHWLPMLHHDL